MIALRRSRYPTHLRSRAALRSAANRRLELELLESRDLLSGQSPVAIADFYEVAQDSVLFATDANRFQLTSSMVQWTIEAGGNGHVYEHVDAGSTWIQARGAAEAKTLGDTPGHLVTITSAEELDFVSAVMPNERTWIGAFQDKNSPSFSEPDGGWSWVTNEPWDFTNWNTSEPNDSGPEDYAEFGTDYRWNDLAVWNRQNYIIEYPVSPSATTDIRSLVSASDSWNYLNDGSELGTDWRTVGYDDTAWLSGEAELGYGEGDETTTVGFGADPNAKPITTYFRHEFATNSASLASDLSLYLKRDDGASAYLNGVQVVRDGLPMDTSHETLADLAADDGQDFHFFQLDPQLLVNGTNVLAVEIHQASSDSDDLSFAAQLTGTFAGTGSVTTNDSDAEGDALTAVLRSGPSNGDLDFESDGTFTYTPNDGFVGADSFVYRLNDGTSNSADTSVFLQVVPPTAAPQAEPESYTAFREGTLSVSASNGVLLNDSDEDSDALSAVLIMQPSNGEVTLKSNGSFDYAPDGQYVGEVVFEYVVIDGQFHSQVTSVTIEVQTAGLDIPIALNDHYEVTEGTTLVVDGSEERPSVLANDLDPEGDDLTAILVSEPTNGSVTLDPDGLFVYVPNESFKGTDTFAYQATDGTYTSPPATVTIDVVDINEAPVAVDDSFRTGENERLNVAAALGLLRNDMDPDGNSLTAILVTPTANGTLALGDDGSFTYVPNIGFRGADRFRYRVSDGKLLSDIATAEIFVGHLPFVPVTRDDYFAVMEDTTLIVENTVQQSIRTATVNGGELRDVAYDPVGDMLYVAVRDNNAVYPINPNTAEVGTPIIIPSQPDELVITDDGQFMYVGADGANSIVRVDLATRSIDITIPLGSNYAQDIHTVPNQSDSIAVVKNNWGGLEIFKNDTRRIQGDRWNNQIEFNDDGTVLFGFTSDVSSFDIKRYDVSPLGLHIDSQVAWIDGIVFNETFDYANDKLFFSGGTVLSASSLAKIGHINRPFGAEVVPIPGPERVAVLTDQADTIRIVDMNTLTLIDQIRVPGVPWAHHGIHFGDDGLAFVDNNRVYIVQSDLVSGVTRHDIMANDLDPEDDPITATLVESTQHGTLNLNEDGTFTYVPEPDFSGIDSFTYTVSDGQNVSEPATVIIDVRPVNDAPTVAPDVYRFTTVGTFVVDDASEGVLANDSDAEGEPLTATIARGPEHGTVELRIDGTFVYNPGPSFTVIDQFTYRAFDSELGSISATVTLTVGDSDEAPIAINDSFDGTEDTTLASSEAPPNVEQVEFIPLGAEWRYLDDGSNQGTSWIQPSFDDSNWSSGPAELGYGDGDEQTTVSYGDSSSDKYVTTYFRHEFDLSSANQVVSLAMLLKRDDGAAVYLNGTEIVRSNLAPGAAYDDWALGTAIFDGAALLPFDDVDPSLLVDGTNVVAVEIHQQSGTSSDISFDLQMTGEVVRPQSVLDNDFSPIGADISALLVDDADHGTVSLNADGTFEYEPEADFFGMDQFTYQATDGNEFSRVANVTINVAGTNDLPDAVDDRYLIGVNESIEVNAANGVIANDIDIDDDSLTATLSRDVMHGSLAFQSNGAFVYTPGPTFELSDSFTYFVSDGIINSAKATVHIDLDVPRIVLGDIYLRPSTPDQEIPIYVESSSIVSGINLFLQVGDGGPELSDFGVPAGKDGPTITGVNLKTGTIFEPVPDPQVDQPGIPQVATTALAISDPDNSVLANGLLATVTIDTTGFLEGSWDLLLKDVLPYAELSGPFSTDFAGLPIHATPVQLIIRETEVVGRHLVYSGSRFDNSLATDKHALMPGEAASFENYSSYSNGINGLAIDVINLLRAPTVDDFEFRVGRNNSIHTWSEAPEPTSVNFVPGAGEDGSDRIQLQWSDKAIFNQWLEVRIKSGTSLGLSNDDVFYFGNAPGETGDSTTNALVSATDVINTRDNKRGPFNPARIEDRYDFNRDGLVNSTDVVFARDNITSPFTALQLITPPPEPEAAPPVARTPRAALVARRFAANVVVQSGPLAKTNDLTTQAIEPSKEVMPERPDNRHSIIWSFMRDRRSNVPRTGHVEALDDVFAQLVGSAGKFREI